MLILNAKKPASIDVFDPAPDYGYETWNADVLASVRKGILLRLVPRDGTDTVAQFDLAALRNAGNAWPPIVLR